jgi:hypothetical protein
MKKGSDIYAELKEMGSILADMPGDMPYQVPEAYFQQFPGSLQSSEAFCEATTTYKWSRQLPYQVPEGYFEGLAGSIAGKVAEGGLPASKLPYGVPAGYFEALPAQVLKATKKSRTIQLPQFSVMKAAKWAAVLFISFGIGFYLHSSNVPNPEKMLSSVPGNDIKDYFQHTYRLDAERIVSNTDISNMPLERTDIIQYLNESGWD